MQLTDEERVYLNAAALGDVPIIRQSLEETNEISLNVNCLDYMGRSALHLAVDSESMEAVELLLDRINFECIEESLLHAISKGATKIVKVRCRFLLYAHMTPTRQNCLVASRRVERCELSRRQSTRIL